MSGQRPPEDADDKVRHQLVKVAYEARAFGDDLPVELQTLFGEDVGDALYGLNVACDADDPDPAVIEQAARGLTRKVTLPLPGLMDSGEPTDAALAFMGCVLTLRGAFRRLDQTQNSIDTESEDEEE